MKPSHSDAEYIPHSRIKGVSSLYAAYTEEYTPLASYFGGDWRQQSSYEQVAARLDKHAIQRDRLTGVLLRQNARWGNASPASQLKDPRALTIVTGQQVGLFGGPLYTLYKAVTTVKLARHLSRVLKRPVVPIFWLEGGDHDLEEVSRIAIDASRDADPVYYKGHIQPGQGNLGSVGSLTFNDDVLRVHDEIRDGLPASSFRDDALARFYSQYRPGVSFTDAFACTLSALLGDYQIVMMDPEDCDLKELAAPIMRREMREYAHTFEKLAATTEELETRFHAQVNVRPFNLFVLSDHGREAVQFDGAKFKLQQSGKVVTLAELLDLAPCLLSPNVVMRPLVQDYLLPTLSYVAGPGEIAYFAQFKPLYDWAGLPMPVVYPRASLTLVEPRAQKVLDQYDLDVPSMQDDVHALMRKLVLSGTPLEQSFLHAAFTLESCAAELKEDVQGVEMTLGRTTEATLRQWQKELAKLKKRVERAEKKRHEQVFIQLQRCQASLYPQGRLQERTLPILYYLARYGDSVLQTVFDQIDVGGTGRHQIIPISSG